MSVHTKYMSQYITYMSVISHICHLAHLITQPVCTFVTHMGSIGLYGYWQIIWATYGYHRPSAYGRFACGPYGTREHTFLANSSASFEFLETIAKKKKKKFLLLYFGYQIPLLYFLCRQKWLDTCFGTRVVSGWNTFSTCTLVYCQTSGVLHVQIQVFIFMTWSIYVGLILERVFTLLINNTSLGWRHKHHLGVGFPAGTN